MRSIAPGDLYSRREIALAAGVAEAEVLALLGPAREFVAHDEAVRVGRALVASRAALGPAVAAGPRRLGSIPLESGRFDSARIPRRPTLPMALSSALHAAAAGLAVVAALKLAPRVGAATAPSPSGRARLVFLATPGPGGGGGGGGALQKAAPPKAMREGRRAVSSPVPARIEPKPVAAVAQPQEPKPRPLASEPLPAVIAPILAAPADARTRAGVLGPSTGEAESRGPGAGGGAGTGRGTGLGEGDGSGVGPGSGGGAGGGPYRPGSGVEPPRLVQEVKASYTEDARRQGIAGDVVLEIVVRRDGSVGDVRVVHGLGGGLNERAAQAVRQWRFAPAHRFGAPVDVVVEVAVEFKLR